MKLVRQLISVATIAAAISMMTVACGGGESECEEGQTFASVNGAPEQCYDPCTDGMCAAGFSCQSGLCVSAVANNSTNNNTTSNNTTSNNTTSNNTTSNNTTSNNTTSNNTNMMTNGQMCDQPVNLGLCEPLCQTGCADDEACSVGTAGPNAPLMAQCVPAGPAGLGAVCNAMTACQKGFVCAADATGMAGTCEEICNPAAPACSAAGATCGPLNTENTIGICVVPMDDCSLFDDMCPQNERCFPTTGGLQCIPGGGTAVGAQCDPQMPQQCDSGLYCIDIDGAGGNPATCRVLCETANPVQCVAGQQCQQSFQGITEFGLCL